MNEKSHKKALYKKWWMWAIIIVAIIGLSGAMSGSKEEAATNASNSSEQANKTEFKVGETAMFDNKSIAVKKVQRNYDTGNQFSQPESGKEFVLVTVEIANNSKSTMDYNTFEFKLQDSSGVQQSESLTALSEGKLNSGSLASGGKVRGNLAYEAPKGDKSLKLLYQGLGFFDDKVVTFNLK